MDWRTVFLILSGAATSMVVRQEYLATWGLVFLVLAAIAFGAFSGWLRSQNR